jgi:hypothetical protein
MLLNTSTRESPPMLITSGLGCHAERNSEVMFCIVVLHTVIGCYVEFNGCGRFMLRTNAFRWHNAEL